MTIGMGPAFWVIRDAPAAYCPVESSAVVNWETWPLSGTFTFSGTGRVDLDFGLGPPDDAYFWVDGSWVLIYDTPNDAREITVASPSSTKFDSVRIWFNSGDWEVTLYDEDLATRVYSVEELNWSIVSFASDIDLGYHVDSGIDPWRAVSCRTYAHPDKGSGADPYTMKNLKKLKIKFIGVTTINGAVDRIEWFCSNPDHGDAALPMKYIYKQAGTGTRVIRTDGGSTVEFTGF